MLNLKKLEKQEQTQTKTGKRKVIIKITTEIKNIKNHKRAMKQLFFWEEINKIGKPLDRLNKGKKDILG
jgi:hypothetical protein